MRISDWSSDVCSSDLYYIGKIASEEPKAFFHIISKDTGFDPLIAHLKSNKIFSCRSASLDGIPILKGLTGASRDDQVDAVVAKLKGMPKSRPQRDKTLRAMISAWFGKSLDESALDRIIKELSRSEEHTSELQSLMRISYAVICLKNKKKSKQKQKL